MKFDEEVMKILEAFDLTGSCKAAARLCGCSHVTVSRYVTLRGNGPTAGTEPPAAAIRDRPFQAQDRRVDQPLARQRESRHMPSQAGGHGLCRIRAHGQKSCG